MMTQINRRYRAMIAAVLVAALVFSLFSFGFTTVSAANHTVTTVCTLNLRSSATTSSTAVMVMSQGTTMTLTEDSVKGWAKLTGSGSTGYASTAYLEVPAGSDVIMTATTDDDLNLRSGRGTSYSSYTVIPQGTTLTVTDNSDDEWAGVKYGSYTGYIKKEYVTINLSIPKTDSSSSQTPTQAPTQAPSQAPTQSTATASASAGSTHRSASFDNLPAQNSYVKSNTAISKLILSDNELSLDINGTCMLTALDASGRTLTGGLSYQSSDTKIATVSAQGLITGVKSGTAAVTVTESSSGLKSSCTVKVSSTVLSTQAPTAAPTQAPTVKPTQAPTTPAAETLSLSASTASVYKGCYYQLIATSNTTVKWSSSNTNIATVSSDGIVTALAAGSVTITAQTSTKSASCKITVTSGSSVNLSHSTASITAGKTFLARCYTSGVTWKSSNTAVATVNNGYILAKKAGKAVITVSTSKGAATMLVTVSAAAPIRFAYTSPNCAAKKETVTLIAITDTSRTAVRFQVTVGSETRTVNATSSTKDGSTLVWKGTTSFTSAGTYQVAAYSLYNNKWSTCDDGKTTAFITNSTDMNTTVCTERRASDGVVQLIANFEGYISSIYDDPITGDPTVGYGRVIYSGEQFYNTMTKNEAFAYLVQTVNNEGYSSKVNSFLVGNKVKFNQQQFDALVCLVYNTGAGILTGDDQLKSALLTCSDGSDGTTTYYINGSYVRIRKGPGTSYDIIRELDYNTTVTVLSTKNSAWYQVKLSDGTTGYVSSDYISKRINGGNLDLNYVNRQNLINKVCQYHHAGGGCVYGLLYRRVDEMEMFLYGDYERNYGIYHYNISFTCANNSSFHT